MKLDRQWDQINTTISKRENKLGHLDEDDVLFRITQILSPLEIRAYDSLMLEQNPFPLEICAYDSLMLGLNPIPSYSNMLEEDKCIGDDGNIRIVCNLSFFSKFLQGKPACVFFLQCILLECWKMMHTEMHLHF